ncbi:PepSY-associated TM helix domain-containing protein [Sandaracinobacter sp. RS1-74]|uniref:PepSY-associated TM helix domain-containing protein n=1 Tax=Sandaracinobacteroides sayramensis TaxID=2913411 RepID=UPI001EDA47B6|nr:PepSY-associated TM helix domain-containing protein [Sandaracinobacteroides sayramensis]MCG2842460.1 PepSY-associated TM helix domain-containing protein [Sandaracinobacteroides sayramensis]
MHGTAAPPPDKTAKAKRAFWLKQLHTWHWISSAVSLVGLLLFTVTGITLNHAGQIEGKPVTVEREAQLPETLRPLVAARESEGADKQERPLPPEIAAWLRSELDVKPRATAEWSADEIYVPLPRPGGDGWVAIDRESGEVLAETSSRGAISYLNDLHKGRNTGTAWSWFIDIFAVASLVFAITGLVLLWLHAHRRPSTWPLVGLGLLLPLLLAMFFIH